MFGGRSPSVAPQAPPLDVPEEGGGPAGEPREGGAGPRGHAVAGGSGEHVPLLHPVGAAHPLSPAVGQLLSWRGPAVLRQAGARRQILPHDGLTYWVTLAQPSRETDIPGAHVPRYMMAFTCASTKFLLV